MMSRLKLDTRIQRAETHDTMPAMAQLPKNQFVKHNCGIGDHQLSSHLFTSVQTNTIYCILTSCQIIIIESTVYLNILKYTRKMLNNCNLKDPETILLS